MVGREVASSMTKVCIIGPGAVGATIACSASKLPIVAIGKHPEVIEVYGLCPGFTFKVTQWNEVVNECLPVFVSVKAHQTPSITEWLNRFQSPLVIVVQNGFYGLELVEHNVHSKTIVAGGIAEFGATRYLNRVEVRGPGKLIVGCKGRDCSRELQPLPMILESPIHVEVTSDITPWRWLKAIINSVVNTITVIYDVPNGAILENESLSRLAHDLTSELSEIVEKKGISLPLNPHDYLERILKATRSNTSSTLQDLRRCRQPEIGWIVEPFLHHSAKLKTLFREVVKTFLDTCGINVPMPDTASIQTSKQI